MKNSQFYFKWYQNQDQNQWKKNMFIILTENFNKKFGKDASKMILIRSKVFAGDSFDNRIRLHKLSGLKMSHSYIVNARRKSMTYFYEKLYKNK